MGQVYTSDICAHAHSHALNVVLYFGYCFFFYFLYNFADHFVSDRFHFSIIHMISSISILAFSIQNQDTCSLYCHSHSH